MKHLRVTAVSVSLATVALATGCVGQIVTSGDYTLGSGETIQGDLVVTFGHTTLEEDSRVTGSVFMSSGELDINGQIDGDVLMSSGDVTLGPDAVVHGDILGTSGDVHQADGARVEGQVSTDASGFNVNGGYLTSILAQTCGLPLLLLGALIYLLAGRGRSRPAVSPEPSGDIVQKLTQLKTMLDDGLLSEGEYEAKKSEILSRM